MKRRITRRRFLSDAGTAAAALPFAASILNAVPTEAGDDSLLLWYDKPAQEWTDALPIGNGRLGAMIFGGPAIEQLQLNEDTLYGGAPYDPNNPQALAALPEARRLIFEGKYKEAHDLVGAKMMAQPIKQMPYQPVGDLKLLFPGHENATNYRRQLQLSTAVAKVSYSVGPTTFTREMFASPVDQVLVVVLSADQPQQLNFSVYFETPQKATVSTESPHTLILRGVNGDAFGIRGGLKFEARVKVLARNDEARLEKDRIVVSNAGSVVLLIAARNQLSKLQRHQRKSDCDNDDPVAAGQPQVIRGVAFAAHSRASAIIWSCQTQPRKDRVCRSADGPATRAVSQRSGSSSRYALFPIRPLPVDLVVACRFPTRQLAGNLEPLHDAALGKQVHDQYQHGDELLARGNDQLVRMSRAAAANGVGTGGERCAHGACSIRRSRLGMSSQHRSLATDRADRWSTLGLLAHRRRVALHAPLGTLRIHRR